MKSANGGKNSSDDHEWNFQQNAPVTKRKCIASLNTSEEGVGKDNYVLYFIKDCDCGDIINERLLPNFIQKADFNNLFNACVECLIYANIRLDSNKFVKLMTRAVGNYSEITIENRSHLRELLDKLCDACGTCRNFNNEEGDEPLMEKVTFTAFRLTSKMISLLFQNQ